MFVICFGFYIDNVKGYILIVCIILYIVYIYNVKYLERELVVGCNICYFLNGVYYIGSFWLEKLLIVMYFRFVFF